MSQEVLSFEVGEKGFDKYVIENSTKLPVLVEFMAVWSDPCIAMENSLQELAAEFAGQLVFAKVDVDEQKALHERFDIQNVPTLLLFRNGKVEFSQQGQMHQDELRALLKGIGIVNEADELREQARARHMDGDTQEAILLLTQAIKKDPRNIRVAMDMIQIFIDIDELDQAQVLLDKLPVAARDSDTGMSLLGQIKFAMLAKDTEGLDELSSRVAQDADDHQARFDLVVCLVAAHDYDNAMEHLFALFEKAPDFRDGAAREMIIAITNQLMPRYPDKAQTYRRRLGSMTAE